MKDLFSRVWTSIQNVARTSPVKNVDAGIWFGPNLAGVPVDEIRALRLATVWACVRVISESIAVLPWQVYRKEAEKRITYDTHPAAWLLLNQANPDTTAYAFKEMMLASALLWGNGYAEIERDTSNRPLNLWQLEPWRVRMERDGRRLVYVVRNENGPDAVLLAENVFHIHGLSLDGLTGLNPIKYGSDSIALSLAMEQFGSAFFGNGSSPSGVFETTEGMGPEAVKAFKEEYQKSKVGPRNARRDIVLPKGMTWKQISVQPDESQFNESRQLQVEDVARRYRVPPHKIGHLARATNNNIEHQSIEFVQDCLLPWCVRLEQEANIKLFGRAQMGVAYTKLNLMSLLRGDAKSQADAFKIGHDGGWLSANDIRRMMDLDPIGPQGDVYILPLNTISAEHFDEFSEKTAQPKETQPSQTPMNEDTTTEEPQQEDTTTSSQEPVARQEKITRRLAHMLKVVNGGRNGS